MIELTSHIPVTSADHRYCEAGEIRTCDSTWVDGCGDWYCDSTPQETCEHGCVDQRDGALEVSCCPTPSTACHDAGWDGAASEFCVGADLYTCALGGMPGCGVVEELSLIAEGSALCE